MIVFIYDGWWTNNVQDIVKVLTANAEKATKLAFIYFTSPSCSACSSCFIKRSFHLSEWRLGLLLPQSR